MKPHYLVGNCSALFAAGLFGAAVVATRVAVQAVPPFNLAVLRFGQGGLILLLCLFLGARDLLRIKRPDIPYFILLGAILFAAFPVTFHIGIKYTEASRGALMVATMPIWSALLARFLRRERLSLRQSAGILVTIAGVGIVLAERGLSWQGNTMALAGDGLMLLTAFWAALYGVLAPRLLTRYTALCVTTYAMLSGTVLLLPAALIEGLPQALRQIDGTTAALILFLGIFGGALGFFLWTSALNYLSPTQVAVYGNVNPMVAIVLGVALLAESATATFVAGAITTVAGVLLVNWPRTPPTKPPPLPQQAPYLPGHRRL